MKLINSTTKKEIKVGDEVTTFRGEKAVLRGSEEPKHPASSGRVYVRFDGHDYDMSYFPSVIGAEFVK